MKRNETKKIKVGNIYIGGQDKILIQSMCNIKTSRVDEVVKQINECALYGADLMRVSVLDEEDAYAIKELKSKISVPLIADIHFDYRLALISMESGVDAIRINPGNIGSEENIKKVIDMAKEKNVPIRVGVNSGSLDKSINDSTKKVSSDELVESVRRTIKILEDLDFHNIVISLKGSDAVETIEAYRAASKAFEYPLHVGVTEAGPKDVGLIRSTAALSPILLDGIGDTIRISLSDDPVEEVKACKRLLKDLGFIKDNPTLISCPTCGRTQVNLIPLAKRVLEYLEKNKINKTVAIMGCIVNGPGEAKRADIGCAGGIGKWVIFKKGEIIKQTTDEKVFDELVEEINKL